MSNDQKKQKLVQLIELFINCMSEDLASDEHKKLAQKFNRMFDSFLEEYRTESIGTFAKRLSEMDMPYNEVFTDIIYVRNIGS